MKNLLKIIVVSLALAGVAASPAPNEYQFLAQDLRHNAYVADGYAAMLERAGADPYHVGYWAGRRDAMNDASDRILAIEP